MTSTLLRRAAVRLRSRSASARVVRRQARARALGDAAPRPEGVAITGAGHAVSGAPAEPSGSRAAPPLPVPGAWEEVSPARYLDALAALDGRALRARVLRGPPGAVLVTRRADDAPVGLVVRAGEATPGDEGAGLADTPGRFYLAARSDDGIAVAR